MRISVLSLCLLGLPAFAQDTGDAGPQADTGLVTACLGNAGEASSEAAECIGVAAQACMTQPDGETTAGMVFCMGQEAEFWDKMLNDNYQALMTRAKTKGADARESEALLRQMQRAWIAYRDSACMWDSAPWNGGTMVQLAYNSCMLDEVGRQALRLQGGEAEGICEAGTADAIPVVADCARKGYGDWDQMLNDSYQALMDGSKAIEADMADSGIPAELAPALLLRQMQRDWVSYRDYVCYWQATQPGADPMPNQAHADCMLQEVGRQAMRLKAAQDQMN